MNFDELEVSYFFSVYLVKFLWGGSLVFFYMILYLTCFIFLVNVFYLDRFYRRRELF